MSVGIVRSEGTEGGTVTSAGRQARGPGAVDLAHDAGGSKQRERPSAPGTPPTTAQMLQLRASLAALSQILNVCTSAVVIPLCTLPRNADSRGGTAVKNGIVVMGSAKREHCGNFSCGSVSVARRARAQRCGLE